MNNNSLLKKEGITNIKKLNRKDVTAISRDVAIKLCLAFPDYNLNRSYLFDVISTINMYTASIPNDNSGAKYIIDTNSIYFNNTVPFEDLPGIAMHECIHFLQMQNVNNCISNNIALNEAAVQLMAAEANMNTYQTEKLFGLSIKTNTPDYYPLECAIVKQLTYFTGDYPLYASTLNNNDIFKKTFINKFNKRIYNYIVKNLDKLLSLENDLHAYSVELSNATKEYNIKALNAIISSQKEDIANLFIKIQNYIIKNCFCIEFNNITDEYTLYDFKKSLYYFKAVIAYYDNYTYYNEFYCDMMNALENKKNQLEKLKTTNSVATSPTSLIIIDKKKPSLLLIYKTIRKLKKLIGMNVVENR